jgi:pyrimidine-specific ribonucleoside hydrolase
MLEAGRQAPERVARTQGGLPDDWLAADVRERRLAILRRNGAVEWELQLRVHEFHQHLGAWTVIGAKMGLRAAELLNAPPHAMQVVSHVPLVPPRGCLNDGLIVATGCTPGRGLFGCEPLKGDDATRATFRWLGKEVTLTLRTERAAQVAAEIRRLLAEHGLENPAYWEGVRAFALRVWEEWHRTEIFDAR